MKTMLFAVRSGVMLALFSVTATQAQPWSIAATNATPGKPLPPPVSVPAPRPAPPVAQPAPNPMFANAPLPEGILAFDGEQKEYLAKSGEQNAPFVFTVTNISPAEVTISYIQTSCGCTTAKIQLPAKLAPHAALDIPVNMSIAGKPPGVIVKTVTIHTDKGLKALLVKTTIEAQSADPAMQALERERNQKIALQNRQSVFQGDCARCHVEPVIGKMGHDLYAAACGICHEAEHRATMVPDLHQLKVVTNEEYWKFTIVNGKPATLMPAFAQAQGGPLSDAQIASLVQYLVKDFPATKTNAPAHAKAL